MNKKRPRIICRKTDLFNINDWNAADALFKDAEFQQGWTGKPTEAPSGTGWESKMVEYPNIIMENGKLRLFYCGNGYGITGIGTALAEPLE